MAEAGEPGFEDAEDEFFPTSQAIDEQDGSLPDEAFAVPENDFNLAAQLAAARQSEKLALEDKAAALKELEDFVNMAEQLGNEKVHFQEKCAELTKANEELQEQVESLSIDKEILEHTLETLQGGGDDVVKARDENVKLRAALRQLHEVSSAEKLALQEQLQGAQAELALAKDKGALGEAHAQQLEVAKAEIESLKQIIDDHRALESLVESLSAKNLAAEERLARLDEAEAELSDLHALTEEMDRHHLEIQRELQEDIGRKTKALLKQTEVVTTLQSKLAATEGSLAQALTELAERRADVASLLLRLEQREAAAEESLKGVAQDRSLRARVDELEAQGSILAARLQAARKEVVCQAQHAERLMSFLPHESCKADCEALRSLAAVNRVLAQLDVATRQFLPTLISRQSAAVADASSGNATFPGARPGEGAAGAQPSLRASLHSLAVVQERLLSAECYARDLLALFVGCDGDLFLASAGRHLEWEGLLTSVQVTLDKLQSDMEPPQVAALAADARHIASTIQAELDAALSAHDAAQAAAAAADPGTPSRRQSLASGPFSPGRSRASNSVGTPGSSGGDATRRNIERDLLGQQSTHGDVLAQGPPGAPSLRSLFHAHEDDQGLSVPQLEMYARLLEGRCQVAAELAHGVACQLAHRDSSFSWASASVTGASSADTLEDSREDTGAWLSGPQDGPSLESGLTAGWLPHLRRALGSARRLKGRAARLCQGSAPQGASEADTERVTDVVLGSMVMTSLALSEALISDLDSAINKVRAMGSSDMQARAWDHLVQAVGGGTLAMGDASTSSSSGSSAHAMEAMSAAGARLSTQVDALVESIATALDHMDTAVSHPPSGTGGAALPLPPVPGVLETGTRAGASSAAGSGATALSRSASAGQRSPAARRAPWVERAESLLRQWSSGSRAADQGGQLAASQEATQAEIAKLAAAVAEKGRALMHASAREAQLARDVEAAKSDARAASEAVAGMLAEITGLRQEEEKARLRSEQLAKAVESYKRENASFRQRIQKYAQQLQKGAMGPLAAGAATPLHESSLTSPSSALDDVPPSPSESVRGAKGGARSFFSGDAASAAEVDALRRALANAESFVARQLAADIDKKLAELDAFPLASPGAPLASLPAATSLLQATALVGGGLPSSRVAVTSPPGVGQGWRRSGGAGPSPAGGAVLVVSEAEYRQQLDALQQVLQDLDYSQLPRLQPLTSTQRSKLGSSATGTSSSKEAGVRPPARACSDRADGNTGMNVEEAASHAAGHAGGRQASEPGAEDGAQGDPAEGARAQPAPLFAKLDRVSPRHVHARRVLDGVWSWVRAKEVSTGVAVGGSGSGGKLGAAGGDITAGAGFGPFAGSKGPSMALPTLSSISQSQPLPVLCGQIRIPLLIERYGAKPSSEDRPLAVGGITAADLQPMSSVHKDLQAPSIHGARTCSAKVLLQGSHSDLRRLWAAASLPIF